MASRRRQIDVIGFHGQTVLHRPQARLTVQIGDGAALAGACGIARRFDMRAADVAAGGQGAPLVPVYHQALARAATGCPVMSSSPISAASPTSPRWRRGAIRWPATRGRAMRCSTI
jgi:1,6-anhydro-N-acetylmuramate kinase